jgi:uncharacterized protein (TIGR01370 family)
MRQSLMSLQAHKTSFGVTLLAFLSGCSGSQVNNSQQDVSTNSGRAVAVWNQAYQENFESDSIADIRANARKAYVLLDPFKDELEQNGQQTVAEIRANGNQASAYISIGTGEDWRDDYAQLKPHLVAKQWGDWAGEYFVSTPNETVVNIMKARIDRIADLGFDWVEFDNMDWIHDDEYRAEYGFQASMNDGTAYYQELCSYVQARGMKCMAKSTVEDADSFDGVTYESYPDDKNWWDENGAKRFLDAGKLVVIVHYDEPDCEGIYSDYRTIYGPDLSFICENPIQDGYVHFND